MIRGVAAVTVLPVFINYSVLNTHGPVGNARQRRRRQKLSIYLLVPYFTYK
jgi:hypothetical protein